MSDDERQLLTTHVEVTEHGATYIEVDAEGNMAADKDEWFAGIVVVDPKGTHPQLHKLDTTGHYENDAEGNDA
jgi:hypothetical protein